MTRHAPVSAAIPEIEDMTPTEVELQSVEYQPIREEHPDWPAGLKFIWQVDPNDPEDTLWTYAGISFGKNRSTGSMSRMVLILNALFGKSPQTPVLGLDDAAWTVEYANGEVRQLEAGLKVTILGHREETPEGTRFKVDMYGPPKSSRPIAVAVAAPVIETEVAAGVAADEIPF